MKKPETKMERMAHILRAMKEGVSYTARQLSKITGLSVHVVNGIMRMLHYRGYVEPAGTERRDKQKHGKISLWKRTSKNPYWRIKKLL